MSTVLNPTFIQGERKSIVPQLTKDDYTTIYNALGTLSISLHAMRGVLQDTYIDSSVENEIASYELIRKKIFLTMEDSDL